MIVSHSKKFIFFKSRKTASSSIQVALSQICDPDQDIITGSNIKDGVLDESHSAGWNMGKFFTTHPHPSVEEFERWANGRFKDYKRIVWVRNPYDIVVSRYHWDIKGKKHSETSVQGFRNWIKTYCHPQGTYWQDLQIRYVPLNTFFIGRYEQLASDWDMLANLIGEKLQSLPSLKSGYRDGRHYSEYYDEESIELVREYFKEDLERLEYDIEFKPDLRIINPKSILNLHAINDTNINGPCLIRVPDFIKNPLGKYYLYFAHHQGKEIRLAYSDNIRGPYTIYSFGSLKIDETNCKTHIASPDIQIRDKTIEMYYHGDYEDGQKTSRAISTDGINFVTVEEKIAHFYFREFEYLGKTLAIAKEGNIGGIIYEKVGDKWIESFQAFPGMRHASVWVRGNTLYIFYTLVGEAPESIYICKIEDWEVVTNYKLRAPTETWEGADMPLEPSKYGMSHGFVNQLRDPYVYSHRGNNYLLYCYGGESGIAIGKLEKI